MAVRKKMSWHHERRAWQSMIQRCHNTKCHNYSDYGGRGIIVCEEWRKSFDAFFTHIGPRPSKDHSVDRYPDKDGNYEPGNVRWATREEQQNNTRKTILLTAFGKTQGVAQWAREYGINDRTIFVRLRNGMSVEDAISTPLMKESVFIDAFGRRMTLAEWSRETGIESTTISNRISAGVPVEEALSKPTRTVLIEAFGRKQKLSAWARELGINKGTLACRIRRGISPEVALTAEPNKAPRKIRSDKRN